uniref:PGG domain-containing protein n=1 Tax=Setaria italica TaxID=4555 RepID=K3ZC45_SETIT
MASINEEEAPSSPNAPTVAMDAKLMVATDRGDVKKLKGLLNKEDAMAMVVVTAATSKKPSKEDQFPAGRINPLLLVSACVGSWKALNFLLEREDAKKAPMVAPTQEFLELLAGGSATKGRIAVSAAVASNGYNGDDSLKYAGIICDRDRDLLFAKNHMGNTPLHCAVRAGSSKMVSRLIALAEHEGAEGKLKLLRMENERHETALHEAVRIEDSRILPDLETLYAVLTDEDIRSPGHKGDADGGGAPEEKNMVRLLMGSDPELANYPAKGISPLCLAILLKKDTIAVTLYKKSGGNLSYSGPDGQNALHVAVLRATTNTVMVEVLFRWNKSLPTQGDKHGSTPLHFASSLHCPFDFFWISNIVAKVFKANPAALYQADNSGLFPIHVAASIGTTSTVEFFLQKSPSSAGLRNAKGRTFLHVAVEKRRREIVSFVCQTPSAEWILNMQDMDGNTALHLATKSRMLKTCSTLLGNKKVHLNLSNVKGHTPLDLSRSNLPRGIYCYQTAESRIHTALKLFGAKHSGLRCDHIEQKYRRPLNQKEKKKQSDLIKDTTQMLIVGAVLIATVAFGATFAIPGGYKADDHLNGGTPTLAGRYIFDAYMMANTLAFVCSTAATIALVVSGTAMIDLGTRQRNLNAAVFMLYSSVTSMTVAFALAAYMVLAPVARSTAIAIFMISPLPVLFISVEGMFKWGLLARARLVRMGPIPAMRSFAMAVIGLIVFVLWPLIFTFAWAAFARILH